MTNIYFNFCRGYQQSYWFYNDTYTFIDSFDFYYEQFFNQKYLIMCFGVYNMLTIDKWLISIVER